MTVFLELNGVLKKNVCRYENPQSRVDCGFPGITPEQCDDRNCCYDENVKGVKFCFKR